MSLDALLRRSRRQRQLASGSPRSGHDDRVERLDRRASRRGSTPRRARGRSRARCLAAWSTRCRGPSFRRHASGRGRDADRLRPLGFVANRRRAWRECDHIASAAGRRCTACSMARRRRPARARREPTAHHHAPGSNGVRRVAAARENRSARTCRSPRSAGTTANRLLSAALAPGTPLGHGDRSEQLHRLQRMRRRLLCGEQHRGRRRTVLRARARDVVDSDRAARAHARD